MLQQSDDGADCDVGPKDDGQYRMEGRLIVQAEEDHENKSNNNNSPMKRAWRQKLDRYQKLFDPESLRPYDVVVLVTGTNDLKSMLLPFILDDEDRQLREQIKGREGGFIEDVRLFIQTLNAKMEERVQKFRDNLEQQVEKTLQEIRDSVEELAIAMDVDMDDYFEQIIGPLDSTALQQPPTNSTESSSSDGGLGFTRLFVLPAMPARALPSLRSMIPLRWLAIPVFDMMGRKKKQFARSNSDSVLFVEGPSFHDIVDYEEHRGPVWDRRSDEDVLLSLRDIGQEESDAIEEAMEKYYSSKDESFLEPGEPGAKSFCIDGIHPSEGGYTLWGEFIRVLCDVIHYITYLFCMEAD